MGGAPIGNVNGCAWKAEHSNALAAMVVAGELSFASIAVALNDKFGTGYTRNAVIGRSGRMGLSNKTFVGSHPFGTKGSRKSAKKAVNKPVVRIVRANGNSNRLRMNISVETDSFMPRCVEVVPRNISLIDLARDDCRYPYGEGPFVFCGRPQRAESSYCPAHSFLTVHTPQRRAMSRDERLAHRRDYTRAYRASKRMELTA